MSNDGRREFRHHAGAHWLNLLATVGFVRGPAPIERMWDTDRLSQWLRYELRTSPDLPVTKDDLVYVKRLRESLRTLAYGAIDGLEPDPDAVAAVNKALSAYKPPAVYVAEGRLQYTAPTSVRQAMSWIARHAVTALTDGDVAHLRTCAEPTCGSIFLDPTGRRRWCPSGGCGVKARVRAHRERQAASALTDEGQG